MSRKQKTRRRNNTAAPAQIELLENRTLLAAIVDSIQIENQAPIVLPDVNGRELLAFVDNDSTRLFTTDGTHAGTTLFQNIPGRLEASASDGIVIGNHLFITLERNNSTELWSTNGTTEGTILVQQGVQSPFNDYAILNDELVFSAESSGTIGEELYKSNGGPATLVSDIAPGLATTRIALASEVGTHFELWINQLDLNDGSLVTARIVHEKNIAGDGDNRHDVQLPLGRYRYWFRSTDAESNVGDWSAPKDFYVGNSSYSGAPSDFTVYQNEVYFSAYHPDTGRELWKTDGTEAGTQLVADVNSNPGLGSHPDSLIEFDGELSFRSEGDLYRTDGTSTPTLIVDLENPVQSVATINNHLIAIEINDNQQTGFLRLISIAAGNSQTVQELHRVDHSTGDYPSWRNGLDSFTVVDDQLAFLSKEFLRAGSFNLSPSDDRHLPSSVPRFWVRKTGTWYTTDGTTAGTHQLAGDTIEIQETEVYQTDTDPTLVVTSQLGDFTVAHTRGIWQLDNTTATRVATYPNAAVVEDRLFSVGGTETVVAMDALGNTQQQNIVFKNATRVDELANSAWVTAALEDGTALHRLDTSINASPGPAITAPTHGATLSSGQIQVTWNSVANAQSYDVRVQPAMFDNDPNATPLLAIESTIDTSATVDFPAGLYRLLVRTNLTDGSISEWTQTVITIATPTVAGPAILSPKTDEHFKESVLVEWQAVANAESYELRINGFDNAPPSVTGIATTSYSIDAAPGANAIVVRARFADGTVSTWTESDEFTAAPAPEILSVTQTDVANLLEVSVPAASFSRTMIYVLTDAVSGESIQPQHIRLYKSHTLFNVSVPYTGTFHLELRYTKSDDVYPFTKKYHSPTSTTIVDVTIPFAEEHPGITTAITAGPRLDLYWSGPSTAVAFDVRVTTSDAGNVTEFASFSNITANELFIDRPDDDRIYAYEVTGIDSSGNRSATASGTFSSDRGGINLTPENGVHFTETPNLEWEPVNLRLPAVVSYELLMVGENDTYRKTGLLVTNHTVERPLQSGTYQTYVRATLTDGSRTHWALPAGETIVVATVPETPEITAPNTATTDKRPAMEWEPTPGADHYELWVSTIADIAPVIHEQQLTTTRHVPTADMPTGQYRMWVRSHRADGAKSKWTATHRFEVIANETVQFTGGIGDQPAGEHTISWTQIPDAANYEMYINPVGQRGTATYRTAEITSTSHTVETNLPGWQDYEVWVRAIFGAGQRSRWGSPAILTVTADFSNITPSLSINDNIASWPTTAGAGQYELWVNQLDADDTSQTIQVRAIHTRIAETQFNMDLAPGRYRGWLRIFGAQDHQRSLWSEAVEFTVE